ncbi:MAG: hypothetical protein ACRD3I_05400 [Terriglobales bacterium]
MPEPLGFDAVRSAILKWPDSDRRRLAAWLQSLGAVAAHSPTAAFDSGRTLYAEVARTLGETGYDMPPWDRFARLKPALAGTIRSTAAHFDASLMRAFPGITRTDFGAMRAFLVDCSRNRCKDENRALTLRSILDGLVPLEELLDNRFPDLRTSGQLSPVLLNFLHKRPPLDEQKEV